MSSKSVKEDRDARRSRRAAEGAQAMSDYLKAEAAIRERTAQLRTLRLGRASAPKS